jgi:hypothetical protein
MSTQYARWHLWKILRMVFICLPNTTLSITHFTWIGRNGKGRVISDSASPNFLPTSKMVMVAEQEDAGSLYLPEWLSHSCGFESRPSPLQRHRTATIMIA